MTHLVYLAAWMFDAGVSIADAVGIPPFEVDLVPPPADALAQFCGDVDPAVADVTALLDEITKR